MGVIRSFVQEKIMHDHAVHSGQTCRHMFGIGVRLKDIFALAVKPFKITRHRCIQHIGDAQARF